MKEDADTEHCAGDPLDAVNGLHLVRQEQSVDRRPPTEMELIERALAMGPGAVDVIERIVGMKERSEDRQAKRDFATALRKLQRSIPPIATNGTGDRGIKYMLYEDIMLAVAPRLDEHGFSVSFKEHSQDDKGNVKFELHLWHDAGHLEIYPRTFPTDKAAIGQKGPIRNAIQDAGSTTSYAKRYLLIQALNIPEKGMDRNGEGQKFISEESVIWLRAMCNKTKTTPEDFLKQIAKAESFEKISERQYQHCKTALEALKREQEKPV